MQFSLITILLAAATIQAAALPPRTETSSVDMYAASAVSAKHNGTHHRHHAVSKAQTKGDVYPAKPAERAALDEHLEVRRNVEKRAGVSGKITTTAGTSDYTTAATDAINSVLGQPWVKKISNWEQARQNFTQQATQALWDKNPSQQRYPAAVCYADKYELKNALGIEGEVKVSLKGGLLQSTEYDCMYLAGNNTFYTNTKGDRGFQNLAYNYDNNRCTFDTKTGDLTCI